MMRAVLMVMALLSSGCILLEEDASGRRLGEGSRTDCTLSAAAAIRIAEPLANEWDAKAFMTEVVGFENAARAVCTKDILGDGLADHWRISYESPDKPSLHFSVEMDGAGTIDRGRSRERDNDSFDIYLGGPNMGGLKVDSVEAADRMAEANPAWRSAMGRDDLFIVWRLGPTLFWATTLTAEDAAEPCASGLVDGATAEFSQDIEGFCEERKRDWEETFG